MARGVPHDDQKRAAVVSALLEGQSVSQVSRDYNVSRASVIAWREAAGLRSTPVEQEKRDEIGGLVADALRGYLTAVSVLTSRTHDEAWFNRQDAADVAVLIGVLTDKAVRILEAIESAEPADNRTGAPVAASSGTD